MSPERTLAGQIRQALLNAMGAYEAIDLAGLGAELPGLRSCQQNNILALDAVAELERDEQRPIMLEREANLHKRALWHVLRRTGPVSISEIALVRFDVKRSYVEHTVNPDGSHTLRATEVAQEPTP